MAVPDFQTLMRPLLAETEDGQEHEISAVRQALAEQFALSDADLAERIPSGRVTKLQKSCGVGCDLPLSLRAPRTRRAHYKITDRGRGALSENAERIDLEVLSQFPEFHEFRQATRPAPDGDGAPSGTEATETETAEERIEAGYRELRSALAAEVLDRVRDQTWEFFEDLVLDVLRGMGYGGPRGSAERLGRSGDEGVDGVIREDALGLDLIYVQAKKWANNVQRPDIQRFFGALHGQRATKGIFITTSDFSAQAREYTDGVSPRVILVDGQQLAELMVDHGVGVTVEHTYELKRLDLDYFVLDDESAPAG
jgi:restriction system protein